VLLKALFIPTKIRKGPKKGVTLLTKQSSFVVRVFLFWFFQLKQHKSEGQNSKTTIKLLMCFGGPSSLGLFPLLSPFLSKCVFVVEKALKPFKQKQKQTQKSLFPFAKQANLLWKRKKHKSVSWLVLVFCWLTIFGKWFKGAQEIDKTKRYCVTWEKDNKVFFNTHSNVFLS